MFYIEINFLEYEMGTNGVSEQGSVDGVDEKRTI